VEPFERAAEVLPEIWLQPSCCSDPYEGRMWSDAPGEPCEESGQEWVRYVPAQSIRETGAGGGWIRLDDAIAVIENHHPDASFDDSQAGHIERRALLSNIIAELRAATPSGGGDAG